MLFTYTDCLFHLFSHRLHCARTEASAQSWLTPSGVAGTSGQSMRDHSQLCRLNVTGELTHPKRPPGCPRDVSPNPVYEHSIAP